MKNIGRYVSYIIFAVNFFVVILLLLSGYSSYVSPAKFPLWSSLGLVFIIFFIINVLFLFVWMFVKRKFLVLPLLAIVLSLGAFSKVMSLNLSKEVPEKHITFLSYNVMGFRWQQIDKDSKRNEIVKYIEDSGADIVCIQEYILSNLPTHLTEKNLKRRLKDYPYSRSIRVGDEKKGTDNRVACFSKYPIISAERIEYESRYNGSALFKLNIEGDTVVVVNNHLESNKLTKEDKDAYQRIIDHADAEDVKSGVFSLLKKLASAAQTRAEQAEIVKLKIDEYSKYPMIVCGDFNDGPLSYAYRVIRGDLKDAFVEAGLGMGISYNQNKFYFRIDNIMVNDFWDIYSCKVDKSIDDSDHYPIVAKLSLKQEE